jgi:hypothetical protein
MASAERSASTARSVRFRPDRGSLAVAGIWLIGAAPLAASKPWLAWLLVPPLVLAIWAARARVTADADRITVCNGLATKRLLWREVDGFDVRRRGGLSPVVLRTTGGDRVRLTVLRRAQLPRLLEAGQPG